MRVWNLRGPWLWIVGLLVLASSGQVSATPSSTITDICPDNAVVDRAGDYQPGGIILTTFDRNNLWVYDIDRSRRYPLPDTVPCNMNCHMSQDRRWITFFNDQTNTYNKMRLDGTERQLLVPDAGDVEWWTPDTLLVWTPGHDAYLRPEAEDHREYLNVNGVLAVQPGGRWALGVQPEGDGFERVLVNLELRGLINVRAQQLALGPDLPYFDNAAWSPDGQWLAYVTAGSYDPEVGTTGGELFGVRPGDTAPTQWTNLTATYGAVRINGRSVGQLAWSPDGTHLAFWVMEMTGPSPEGNVGNAVIHVVDIQTGDIERYCGYSTTEHTPNPPRLIWSPDSTHIAFGGNIPGDNRGYLLLALDTATGVFTTLSDGIYPALGTADVIAWGQPLQ